MAVVLHEPTRTRARSGGQRLLLVAGLAVVGIALAVRLMLLVRSSWVLEGDDALSALMALRVLDGDRPIMLKNQTYAAAWEPYAMALSFAEKSTIAKSVAVSAPLLELFVGTLALGEPMTYPSRFANSSVGAPAGKHFDQRRFSGAVVAEQADDFTRPDADGDVPQRRHGLVRFGNARRLEIGLLFHGRRLSGLSD